MSVAQIFSRIVLIVAVFAVVLASARSPHFGDSNQENTDVETANAYESAAAGLTNKDLELMNRLVYLNNMAAGRYPNSWDRFNMEPEVAKRGRSMRCYFNPVSCYKK